MKIGYVVQFRGEKRAPDLGTPKSNIRRQARKEYRYPRHNPAGRSWKLPMISGPVYIDCGSQSSLRADRPLATEREISTLSLFRVKVL
jgi:hypothetical protein